MSDHSDPRLTRTSAGMTRTTTRTRYATGRSRTVAVVAGVRAARRVADTLGRVWRAVTDTVTAGGWMVLGFALVGLTAGLLWGWVELVAAGVAAATLLAFAALFLFGSKAYDVELSVSHNRVVAGSQVEGTLTVTNVGRRVALPGVVDIPVGDGLLEITVPLLAARGTFSEHVTIPARRRGVIQIGPARTVRGDPLGLLRRETTWREHHTLFIHPATTALARTSTGFIRDLEGNPSARIVNEDISFHAIREYAPGDSRRQVHWKSTAKTGTLMVRQYEETRRSRMLVALARGVHEYATDDEFELAVSVAASLGLRGIRDGRDVNVVVGQELPEFVQRTTRAITELPTITGRTLLDALADLDPAASVNPLSDVASLAADAHPDVSVGFLVCGSALTATSLQSAALAFPPDVGVVVVSCNLSAEPGYHRIGDTGVVTVGILEDLRQILARKAATS